MLALRIGIVNDGILLNLYLTKTAKNAVIRPVHGIYVVS